MWETPVRFLGQEDPLEKGMATHSSVLGLLSAGKESACNVGDVGLILNWEDPLEEDMANQVQCRTCKRLRFNPWVEKIARRRKW